MLRSLALIAAASLVFVACDDLEGGTCGARDTAIVDITPSNQTAVQPAPIIDTKIPVADETVRFGTVEYALVSSTCPVENQELWNGTSWGQMVVRDNGEVELEFPNMPTIRGQLGEDIVSMRGSLVFMGETGADVTCTVSGAADFGDDAYETDEVEGEMTEALSSTGDLNCTSTAKFRLVLE